MNKYFLAIDQGTSSTRAIIFNEKGEKISEHQEELTVYFPQKAWVEHDPEEIWLATLMVCRFALEKAQLEAKAIRACGITNQRETTVLWDKKTGKVIHNAIVWQDRRTTDFCNRLRQAGHEKLVQDKTGLLIDPYFSASKIHWLLNNVPEARRLAQTKQLAFGTVDSFLLWRFSKGQVHATDVTNASRTSLFNLSQLTWDDVLLDLFEIPHHILPKVQACNVHFCNIESEFFGAAIPITGVAGDQQAATIGQACFNPGMVKSTYGTGCFLLLNTGEHIVHSKARLLTTIAYQINDTVHYGIEGSIFNAGTTVRWLRDQLKIIKQPADTESLARSLNNNNGVYFVPAFTGLGAPYWDADARAAIVGLTRDSGIAEIARAALEAVCYQTRDILDCMQKECGDEIAEVRVDGGMVANDWLLQYLANILQIPVARPYVIETTALGVAMLSALGCGEFNDLNDLTAHWHYEQRFVPQLNQKQVNAYYAGWQAAVAKVSTEA